MRRRPVGGEQQATSLSRGWQCANTEESFYCTHSSTLLFSLQCSFALFPSSPLFHFLAHHLSLHFSCQFSVSLTFRFLFIADLHLRYLLSHSSVVNTKSGECWVFSKTLTKIGAPCLKRVWNMVGYVYNYDCTWLGKCSWSWIWLHVHHSSRETWRSTVTCMTSEGLSM